MGREAKKKHYFSKELYPMLYGFGDVENPRQDTVELVEELVIDYISDVVTEAVKVSQTASVGALPALPQQNIKVRTEDLLHVLRHDPKKLARVEELLFMNEELKRARKAFDIEEETGVQKEL